MKVIVVKWCQAPVYRLFFNCCTIINIVKPITMSTIEITN
jgi:hypothetical protein